ncbi:MAG TPA: hypothetical protein VKU37_10070 [Verrucomicrobiae bacterium]|nr:hypothetical protein [Verrucomicrobiae bacterium]
MTVKASRMDDREHDDGIVPDNEENAIRKTPGQDAPNFGMLAKQQVMERVFHGSLYGRANLQQ